MGNPCRDTVQIYLKVNRKDIAFLANIISCYDGLALMRTKDPYLALVVWQVSPDFLDDAHALIRSLQKQVSIQIVDWKPDE